MIETRSGKLYTGISNNLARRCKQHSNGTGAKYFRMDRPLFLVWSEFNHDRSSASKREIALKKLNRAQKLKLIHAQTKILLWNTLIL